MSDAPDVSKGQPEILGTPRHVAFLLFAVAFAAVVVTAGIIFGQARSDDGGTGSRLYDAMTAAARVAPTPTPDQRFELEKWVFAYVDTCTGKEATGTVHNNSQLAVNAYIEVDFLIQGMLVENGITSVRGLQPGESGRWSAPYPGRTVPDRCRVRVSAYPAD